MKTVSPQSLTGQLGANFIERIVLRMKYVWRPLLIFDVGIDGEIEICDPVTGEATNTIIRVQAKATTQPFQTESPDSFEYSCDQRDLDYWLRGNAPVILIVCRPDTDEAYWVSIRHYFMDLAVLKARRVHFDKRLNRFEASTASDLARLASPKDLGVYSAPLPKPEKLYSNLLAVTSFASTLYAADTDYRERSDLWAEFNSKGNKVGPEWILNNRRIISFHNLEESPFNTICDLGSLERYDATEWAESEDEDIKRGFVQLLNFALRQRSHLQGLRFYWHKRLAYYHFPATKNLRTRKVKYRSIKQWVSREVFKQYPKKSDPTQRAYCRHSAFKGYFTRLVREWYLEITPTYHFTSNGYDVDMFRAEHVQGIKRLERNPAVIGQLLMWAHYLKSPIRNLFSAEYPFLSFGDLATVDCKVSLPDDIWYQAEEDENEKSMRDRENQPSLFGL